MTPEQRYELCRSVGDECVQEDELREMLRDRDDVVAYDGFEPSGRVHIAQGLLKARRVNALARCGVRHKFWIADWFAQLNGKLGGDLDRIRTVGRYMIEVWRAAGMDLTAVEFLFASDEINKRPAEYWGLVMDVATKNNLARIKRCSQIMGRAESDELSAAQIMYPCMQCADVFFLGVDICQMGTDQRKVNMLAREYCPRGVTKPVVLSHRMLPGLKENQAKMSKSDPSSAIFMDDDEAEVTAKIAAAFCPPGRVEGNPCIEYARHVVFACAGRFEVAPRVYESPDDLEADFAAGALHPKDLKSALALEINALLRPVRAHFSRDPVAMDLLQKVKGFATNGGR